MQGKVKFYNDQKGFGFITYDGGDIFFHIKQCQEGYLPEQDDEVVFEITAGRDGRDSAINVAPAQFEDYEDEEAAPKGAKVIEMIASNDDEYAAAA